MFWNSCKKTCFIPIISFVFLFLSTLSNYIEINHTFASTTKESMLKNTFGFFWTTVADLDFVVSILLVLFGVIAGISLFSFAQSKKHCNVIFSLGMSRKKIFLSKYLGGLLPFCFAVIIAAFFELVAVFSSGFAPTAALIKIAVYFVLYFVGIYAFFFTVTAAIFAFSGNIVEGLIFAGIISLIPMTAGFLFGLFRGLYTLGGIGIYEGSWNFFSPYTDFLAFKDSSSFLVGEYGNAAEDMIYYSGSYEMYFGFKQDGSPFYNLTIYDYSGAIMCLIYAAAIFAIAYLAFSKRKNEISGSFGRAKGLNEICAACVGAFVVDFGVYVVAEGMYGMERGSFLTFLISAGLFIVTYFIFKMVFGHRRKMILKSMLKRIPAYIAALAIFTTIFSTGLFGYASKIPDAENVQSIEFGATVTNPYSTVYYNNSLKRDPTYGYSSMTAYSGFNSTGGLVAFFNGRGSQNIYYPRFSVEDESSIRRLIEIHRSFVQKGHIKATASDTCAMNFQITYTLKNGKTVKRYYSATTEENAKRIFGLSDLAVVKNGLDDYFDSGAFSNYELDQLSEEENPNNYFFLFSKYLKENQNGGFVTDELKKAVLADLENQTSEDIFFHKPEDELGVIVFGTEVSPEDAGWYLNDYGEYVDSQTGKVISSSDREAELTLAKTAFASKDRTIGIMGYTVKAIVLTKSMTNTVKYLTDNGYMKCLESKITASDVKSIRLCTKAESVNKNNIDMLPIFAGGYSSAEDVKNSDNEAKGNSYLLSHYIKKNVPNEITNKSTIQKVLDNCFLYGFCGNDYRIAEITFNDGSIATYCITGEVYDKLMK